MSRWRAKGVRGKPINQPSMIHAIRMEDRVPKDHPLRGIKAIADEILSSLSSQFDAMYSTRGRPSVPPEQLMKATLLMALYSIPSERRFCEHLEYNLLFRWFLDMELEEAAFDHSNFTHHRKRLIDHDVGHVFLGAVVQRAQLMDMVSSEHFTVDGTLIEAWASLKSFRPKDNPRPPSDDDDDKGNPTVDFHGEKRSNKTHASTTDPEARMARKSDGTTAKLSFAAHVLMENRNGLAVAGKVTQATGTAERIAAMELLVENVPGNGRITLAADKAYDTFDFVDVLREQRVTPHIARNEGRRGGSAVDGRTTRHAGYAISQRFRKRVEEIFGWVKTVGGMRRTRVKGVKKTNFLFEMALSAYNLLRMVNILALQSA